MSALLQKLASLVSWLMSLPATLQYLLKPAVVLKAYFDEVVGRDQTEVSVCLDLWPRGFLGPHRALRVRRHFTIIIDVSSSMRDEGRLECAKCAACAAIRLIDPLDGFSVIAFAATAWVVHREPGLPPGSPTNLQEVRAAAAAQEIMRLTTSSNTNYQAALELAHEEFRQSCAEEGQALLLSDGEHNTGDLQEALALLRK